MAQTPEELMGDKVLEAAGKGDAAEVGQTLRTALHRGLNILEVVDARNSYDETSLHVAARHPGDATEMTEALVTCAANINASNYLGQTPLHVAAMSGNIRISELLIREGADIKAADATGKTPLDIAREKAFAQEAALLVAYGGERTPEELTAQQKYAAKLSL